jgi:hypothetical protein
MADRCAVPGDRRDDHAACRRRLIAAGCSADHCLVYYERGGFAHVHYAVVFKVSAKDERFEFGGRASGRLRDLEAVKDAVVSRQGARSGHVEILVIGFTLGGTSPPCCVWCDR